MLFQTKIFSSHKTKRQYQKQDDFQKKTYLNDHSSDRTDCNSLVTSTTGESGSATDSDRTSRVHGVRFSDEVTVQTYKQPSGFSRLAKLRGNRHKTDPTAIWWSRPETAMMKIQNRKVGPSEHAHLVKSLKAFNQLARLSQREIEVPDDDKPNPTDIDEYSVSVVVDGLLCQDGSNKIQESYEICRGLDKWDKALGRADEYRKFVVEYSKDSRKESAAEFEQDLAQKCIELSRVSRQWGYALGRVDAVLAGMGS